MARESLRSFYKTKAWKDLRLIALNRDHFTCQICLNRATEVHHLIELDEENVKDKTISLNINNLQCLCHVCHTRITKKEQTLNGFDCEENFYFDSEGNLLPRGCV